MMRIQPRSLGMILLLTVTAACSGGEQSASESPAHVENAVPEAQLATLTLSSQAEARLGLETSPVELRSLARTRQLGGELTTVPGGHVVLTAPVTGVVLGPAEETAPRAGDRVRSGQSLVRLLPSPPDRDLMTAREELETRRSQFELADSQYQRAQRLLADRAGSVRQMEEARTARDGAQAAFQRARAQLALLEGAPPDSLAALLATMSLEAPFPGVVQRVEVSPGQTVAAGTPLMTVDRVDPLWVRVPVYPGDLETFDTSRPAGVTGLSDRPEEVPLEARPLRAPLIADPAAVTADLFYEVSNPRSRLRPGQRVLVTLPLRTEAEQLVVPYPAVLYDMYGGAWVYARTADHVYRRMRISIDHVVEGLAVLTHGPAVGTLVVIVGAAELFGTEFGVGK